MSKIGKQPITIPDDVQIKLENSLVKVTGPKGFLEQKVSSKLKVLINDKKLEVKRKSETRTARALHGLSRTLIANMIQGVTQGFSKSLELQGTGYRVSLEGKNLKLLVGFSHPVMVEPPENISFEVEDNKIIRVNGIDKQLVGQVAANIRTIRKPDPYKGKGVRYLGEVIKTKPGKSAKVGAAT
jgi:large subunit ribosomal protein L6